MTVDISVTMIAAVPHGSVLGRLSGKVKKSGARPVIFTDAEGYGVKENRLVRAGWKAHLSTMVRLSIKQYGSM